MLNRTRNLVTLCYACLVFPNLALSEELLIQDHCPKPSHIKIEHHKSDFIITPPEGWSLSGYPMISNDHTPKFVRAYAWATDANQRFSPPFKTKNIRCVYTTDVSTDTGIIIKKLNAKNSDFILTNSDATDSKNYWSFTNEYDNFLACDPPDLDMYATCGFMYDSL